MFQCLSERSIFLIEDFREHISSLDPIVQPITLKSHQATPAIWGPLCLCKFLSQSQNCKPKCKCSLALTERVSGPQREIEMINVINNKCNLSYILIENKELLPAVRKVGRNTYTLFQGNKNAFLCSLSKFHSRWASTKVLDGS